MSGKKTDAELKGNLSPQRRAPLLQLLESTASKTLTEFFIKLIYGEDFGLPEWPSDTSIIHITGKQVLEVADTIEKIAYNNFSGKDLAEAIRYLHSKGYIMYVRFGREGSPVVYVQPPYWTHQASNTSDLNGRRFTEEEMKTMYQEIIRTLEKLNPDELDLTEYYGVRAWWD
ncbi:MAG: hypothetical protein QW223_01015 [Candidatus Caldarchaeum sp.]